MRFRAMGRAACAAVGLALSVAGCTTAESTAETAAGTVAGAFERDASGAPATACPLLAPDTRQELEDRSGPCPRSLGEVDLPQAGRVLPVEVYGLDAVVHLEHDTVFLARFEAGWRVTAAGCTPQQSQRPYSCDLKGA